MAYRYGNRTQMSLFPASIEEYVSEDAPVRAYDAFVDALDIEIGISLDIHNVGNASYDPRSMLKLLVYGYSYGVRSSRKLEREVYNNLSFIWLMGGLKPDHKTIAEFRRKNKDAVRQVLRQCARICLKIGLISGNILFVDGTRMRANAGINRTKDESWYKEELKKVDEKIEDLLEACEAADRQEQNEGSYISMTKELSKTEGLKKSIESALEELKRNNDKRVNQTDPDCAIMRSRQGSHASYNVQSVVDDEHGLIVHADAVRDTNDSGQFAEQIEQANNVLDKRCEAACGDAGYANTDELEKIDDQGIKVIVPSQRQSLHKAEKPFSKSEFIYDQERDYYYCPEGHVLRFRGLMKKQGKRSYAITDMKLCLICRHYGQCTQAKEGRRITRLIKEYVKEKLEKQYEEASSRQIYSRRKFRSEIPFGHIKRNLKAGAFLLRGCKGVQAETSLLCTCFNMARMITILGVRGLINKMRLIETYS